jgi:hypothetical protein
MNSTRDMVFRPISKPLSAGFGFEVRFIRMKDAFLGGVAWGQGRKVQTSKETILGMFQGLEGVGRYITGVT